MNINDEYANVILYNNVFISSRMVMGNMILTRRDIRVLTSLRFGVVAITDLLQEHFLSTEIESAPQHFQTLVREQCAQASKQFDFQNQQLIHGVKELCKTIRNHNNQNLKLKLISLAKRDGKHLGKSLLQLFTQQTLQEQSEQNIETWLTTGIQQVIDHQLLKQDNRKATMLCKKVMGKLIQHGLVKELNAIELRGTNTYYHLTRQRGKFLISEILTEQGDYNKVVAHNYHPIHAKHDSMVSSTIKTLFRNADFQGYQINSIQDEAEQKSIQMSNRIGRKINKKRVFYADLIVELCLNNNKILHFQVEIDNNTQPIRNIMGKANKNLPIVFICCSNDRANFIAQKLARDKRPVQFFATSISKFQAGGMFASDFYTYPSGNFGKISAI